MLTLDLNLYAYITAEGFESTSKNQAPVIIEEANAQVTCQYYPNKKVKNVSSISFAVLSCQNLPQVLTSVSFAGSGGAGSCGREA